MDQAPLRSPEPLVPNLNPPLPVVTVDLPIGGQEWRITSVRDQDTLLDLADELANVPYGFLLWEASVLLAQRLLDEAARLPGLRILELGAGLGLPGVVARKLGAEVWQTDHEAQALVLAAHNAAQNGVTGIHHFVADWRSWDHTQQYDLLIGADILYERAMYRHLEPIFRQNLAPGGRLFLTDPSRPQALTFVAELEKRGWHFEITMQPVTLPTAIGLGNTVDVALLVGRRDREVG